ncbi:hypothetical protein BS78_K008400 [Paspalum vaginatum]|uniref:Uncharacterized protein n=1 Tax=Paspalum vaginatum TaxID=158149 RepID=A0A9W8CDY7_9POAL|nr:hypothetical protein BS78_K008400 [Paspalum vaginatum]
MSTASPPRSCSCLQLATGSYQILEEEQTEKLGKFMCCCKSKLGWLR